MHLKITFDAQSRGNLRNGWTTCAQSGRCTTIEVATTPGHVWGTRRAKGNLMPRGESAAEGATTAARAVRPKDAVQSLERAISVLTAFDGEHRVLTLAEVAERCRLPRSAARRFLHTLVQLDFIAQTGRKFELTPMVLELGYSYLASFTVADVCQPHVDELSRSMHASASVTVLEGADARYICRSTIATRMTVSIKTGTRLPAHLTASGRVLLAALPEAQLKRYLTALADQSVSGSLAASERDRLERELAATARQGWALSDQILEVGVRAVAVPLRSRTGREVGALSLSLYDSAEPTRVLVNRCLPPLLEAAGRISLDLRAGIESQ